MFKKHQGQYVFTKTNIRISLHDVNSYGTLNSVLKQISFG
jgi:ASC-1-like (ASCH) protein